MAKFAEKKLPKQKNALKNITEWLMLLNFSERKKGKNCPSKNKFWRISQIGQKLRDPVSLGAIQQNEKSPDGCSKVIQKG